MDWSQHYASRMSRLQASEIRELMKLLSRPDIISFAGGIPDPKLFPVEVIAKACQKILGDPARAAAALQYAASEGYQPLRQWIAAYMTSRGAPCEAQNILITNGSQQGIDFISKLFISPGDTVLTGVPTYLGALQAFNAYEPNFDVLPSEENKRTPESYGPRKPKFGYVLSEFTNPSGLTLSLAERNYLLDCALAIDMPLVEDNAYECMRFDGEPIPSMIALAIQRAGSIEKAKILYCGTFSKSIVPALRIGWVVAPSEVIEKLVLINQASDLHVSPFSQMIMYEVASEIMEEHTSYVRGIYKSRRDAMLEALDAHMPEGVTWTRPEGGMFVWVTLPQGMDAALLLDRALQESVAFIPGVAFHPDRSGANTLRLSYSLNDPSVIKEGIARLGRLIAQVFLEEA